MTLNIGFESNQGYFIISNNRSESHLFFTLQKILFSFLFNLYDMSTLTTLIEFIETEEDLPN